MAAEPAPLRRLTCEEYLAMERRAEARHELWDGEAYAMGGAGYAHNVAKDNLARVLGNLLAERGCRVLTSDMRVRIPERERYVYPDVVVFCGPPQLEDDHGDVLCNPQVVIEVLSDSTAAFDRGSKFAGYRSITSLREYVMVSIGERRVEHFTRGEDPRAWVLRAFEGDTEVPFPTLGVHVSSSAIFDGIDAADEIPAG